MRTKRGSIVVTADGDTVQVETDLGILIPSRGPNVGRKIHHSSTHFYSRSDAYDLMFALAEAFGTRVTE